MGLKHPEHACCFERVSLRHIWSSFVGLRFNGPSFAASGLHCSRRSLRGPWWKQPEVPGRFVRKSKNVSRRPEAVSQNLTILVDGVDAWMLECIDGERRGLCPSLNVDFSI